MQDQPHLLLHLLGKEKQAGNGQGLTLGTYRLWACTSWLRAIPAPPGAAKGAVGYPALAGNPQGTEDNLCVRSNRVLDALE